MKLMTFENENVLVNTIVELGNSKNFELLKEFLKISTKDKLYDYQFNSKVKKIGLRVYRDYFLCLDAVYQAEDNTFVYTELGRIVNGNEVSLHRYMDDKKLVELEKFLGGLLPNTKVCHDYDREQIEEALECGDFDLIEDIIGDRDLAELI